MIYYFTYLPTLAICIYAGIFIFYQNRKSLINRVFVLILCSAFIWVLFNFLTDISKTAEQALLFSKLSLIGPIFAVFLFLLFSEIFPKKNKKINKLLFPLLLIPPVLFLFLIFSHYNIESVVIKDGIVNTKLGYLYYAFLLYAIVYVCFAIYNLIRSYKKNKGIYRTQIEYFLLGIIFSVIIGIIINGILPLIGLYSLGGLGSLSILFFIGFTTYAIVRFRFLDIKLIIKRRIVYPIFLVLILLLYTTGILFITNIVVGSMPVINYVIYFIAIFFGILIFEPIRGLIYKIVDEHLLALPYNHNEILKRTETIFRQSADFNINLEFALKEIKKQMNLKKVAFIMMHKKLDHLFVDHIFIEIGFNKQLKISKSVEEYLEKTKKIIVYEEIRQMEDKYIIDSNMEKIKKDLELMDAYVLVPIILKNKLAGVLIFGEKKSEDAYTVEDIEMFDNLSYHLGSSVEASKLYRQVERQRRDLEKNYHSLKKVTDLVVGRELRMAELKQKVKNLEKRK